MRPVLQRTARVAAGQREEVDDEGVARGDKVVLLHRPREAVAERLDDLQPDNPIDSSRDQNIDSPRQTTTTASITFRPSVHEESKMVSDSLQSPRDLDLLIGFSIRLGV